MIPVLTAAATDPRLRPHDKALMLWVVATGTLDVCDYRPLKLATVQMACRLRKQTAADSLRRLWSLGYLRCGVDDAAAPEVARTSAPRWFRVSWAVPAGAPGARFPHRTEEGRAA